MVVNMDILNLNLQHVPPAGQGVAKPKPQYEILREMFGFTKVSANPKRRDKKRKKKRR